MGEENKEGQKFLSRGVDDDFANLELNDWKRITIDRTVFRNNLDAKACSRAEYLVIGVE